MTIEFFGPLPPSDFNRDAMQRWLDQQVVSFQKIITGSLQADNILSSSNYVPGVSGWMIDGNGNAEFNDVEVRGDIISGNWDGAIPVDLSSYDVGATAGFALDSSEGTAQFMGDVFVGGDLRLRGGTARFGTGPTGGPRIDMMAGQSADGEDNALFTVFHLTNVADPTINSHPAIAAFVSGRGTPGETNSLNLRSGAYGSDGGGHITITSRSLDGSSNPEAIVRIGSPRGPTRFAASDAAFFDDRTFFSDGSASQPAISFQSDPATGLFLPSSGRIGVSVNGMESFRFAAGVHPTDNIFYAPVTGGPQLVADDSGTIPVFTFTNDEDTGMYRVAADVLGFSAGGSAVGSLVSGVNGGHLNRGYRYGGTVYYTSSGTFDKDDYPGLRAVKVQLVGGGGGGGGTLNSNANGASGGHAGGYSEKFILAGSLGSSETVTIGAAGSGGAAGANDGGAGGTTSFGSHCQGTGGGGGNTLGNATTSSPGVGSGGDFNLPGGRADGGSAPGFERRGGSGGSTPLGFGGGGHRTGAGNSQGLPAGGYGSGGGGAVSSSTSLVGGDGAPGIVIVHLYY